MLYAEYLRYYCPYRLSSQSEESGLLGRGIGSAKK